LALIRHQPGCFLESAFEAKAFEAKPCKAKAFEAKVSEAPVSEATALEASAQTHAGIHPGDHPGQTTDPVIRSGHQIRSTDPVSGCHQPPAQAPNLDHSPVPEYLRTLLP